MKRDMDLVRRLLLHIEEQPPGQIWHNALRFDDVSDAIVAEHLLLLKEANMIDAHFVSDMGQIVPSDFVVLRMTWAGHEYVDAIRSDTIWTAVKKTAKDKGLSLAFDVVKALAVAKTKALMSSNGNDLA